MSEIPNSDEWAYDWKLTLSDDLMCDTPLDAPKQFQNDWLTILPEPISGRGCLIIVREGYSWDGCSVVPDAPGTRRASCVHDALYQFSRQIADAWGWSVNQVLRWANKAFRWLMHKDHCPVTGLYYAGVSIFGTAYHTIAGLFGSSDAPVDETTKDQSP